MAVRNPQIRSSCISHLLSNTHFKISLYDKRISISWHFCFHKRNRFFVPTLIIRNWKLLCAKKLVYFCLSHVPNCVTSNKKRHRKNLNNFPLNYSSLSSHKGYQNFGKSVFHLDCGPGGLWRREVETILVLSKFKFDGWAYKRQLPKYSS